MACSRARTVSVRSAGLPMTLTQTRAWARSAVVSTLVTVAKPIRGSFTSRERSPPISCRRSSSIRSVRAVTGRGSCGLASAGSHPADGLRAEALDDVALLEFLVAGQADPALQVLGNLASVGAEATERLDPVSRHDLAAAPHPGPATDDPAVGHEAARDHRGLADLEDLADLCPTLDNLDDFGLEQPPEGGGDVIRQLVDDVVQPDVDAFGLGGPPRGISDLRVEADHDRIRRRGEQDVVVGDVAGRLVEHVQANVVGRELVEGVSDRTERTGHIGLQDDPELLGLAGLDLAIEVLERGSPAALPALGRVGRLARFDQGPGFLLVADHAQDIARFGHV